ncbi:unnamed protein product [Closterium sp. NIES-54]
MSRTCWIDTGSFKRVGQGQFMRWAKLTAEHVSCITDRVALRRIACTRYSARVMSEAGRKGRCAFVQKARNLAQYGSYVGIVDSAPTATTAAATTPTAATTATPTPTAATTEAPTPATTPTAGTTSATSIAYMTTTLASTSTTLATLALVAAALPTKSKSIPNILSTKDVNSSSRSVGGGKGGGGAPLKEGCARSATSSTYSDYASLSCKEYKASESSSGRGRVTSDYSVIQGLSSRLLAKVSAFD